MLGVVGVELELVGWRIVQHLTRNLHPRRLFNLRGNRETKFEEVVEDLPHRPMITLCIDDVFGFHPELSGSEAILFLDPEWQLSGYYRIQVGTARLCRRDDQAANE